MHEPILSIDLNIYPKIIERNDDYKGEFQAYVSGMEETIQITLKNGNEIINLNFEKITISNCQILKFEKECIQSLIGCQWSLNKCSSTTQCEQLSSTSCENTTNVLKDKCERDNDNNSCKNKKLCEEFSDSTECKNNGLGCQWNNEKCIDYFSCKQFDFSTCENTPGKFKDKCEWYKQLPNGYTYCVSKQTSALYSNENLDALDCRRSLLGCKWNIGMSINAEKCDDFIYYSICLNNTGVLKDKCEWYKQRPNDFQHCVSK